MSFNAPGSTEGDYQIANFTEMKCELHRNECACLSFGLCPVFGLVDPVDGFKVVLEDDVPQALGQLVARRHRRDGRRLALGRDRREVGPEDGIPGPLRPVPAGSPGSGKLMIPDLAAADLQRWRGRRRGDDGSSDDRLTDSRVAAIGWHVRYRTGVVVFDILKALLMLETKTQACFLGTSTQWAAIVYREKMYELPLISSLLIRLNYSLVFTCLRLPYSGHIGLQILAHRLPNSSLS